MNAAISSWRTWTNFILPFPFPFPFPFAWPFAWFIAPSRPLIPSPGYPKTVRTPH
jgi:hypothetical protein